MIKKFNELVENINESCKFKFNRITKELEKRLYFNVNPERPHDYYVKCITEVSAYNCDWHPHQEWKIFLYWGNLKITIPSISFKGDILNNRQLIFEEIQKIVPSIMVTMEQTVSETMRDLQLAKKFIGNDINLNDILEIV